jgi:hypothetical protein
MESVIDSALSFLLKLAIYAAFTVAKLSTLMPVTMLRHINPVNSRARTATFQNVAVLLSGRLVLRLCRPLN